MTYQFSHRIDESPLNPIARETARLKAQGEQLTALNDSNPTHFGLAPRILPEEYTADPRGKRSAREELARFLEARMRREQAESAEALDAVEPVDPVDPDSLYLLSSTSQAYAWLFMLLCNPGDVVMGPKPGYPLIESIAGLTSARAVPYTLFYDDFSWTIDVEHLNGLIDEQESAGRKVKALVLINPNNPTGSYVKSEERRSLVDLCREHGIAIIADEVFFDYALDPLPGRARLAGEKSVLTFALDGLSKALAAPHAKVGWIQVSGPWEEVVEAQRRLDVIADDFLPFSDFHIRALGPMLREVPERTDKVRERARRNLAILKGMLAADPSSTLDVLRAEGGWNVLVKFPSSIDENRLSTVLLDRFHKVSQPGYFFDMPANGYTTLSLLPQVEVFRRNVAILMEAVADLLDEGEWE